MALSDKNRQIVTIVSLLGVLLTAGAIYFYFMLARPQIATANKAETEALAKVADYKAEMKTMNDYINNTAEREELEKFMSRAKRRLPSNSEEEATQGFYKIVEDSLRRTGASMSRLAPKDPISRNLYFEIPYELNGAARYHEFGQLLNVIECNPQRLMRISTFAIRNDPKRPSIHPIALTVKTYTFNDMAATRR